MGESLKNIELKKRDHCLSPGEIESRLKEAGVQPTAQRIAICRFVLCQADHPTADQVKDWADKNFPKMSLATVYNTLNLLVKAGLLHELRLPHSDKVIYDNNLSPHHHFLDEKSGELFDLSQEDVEVSTKLKKQFQVSQVQVLLRGILK
jgi:Fur family iron response transcriptional regulator